ncbi:2-phospho-L-lactate transferase CofD family protein [Patulibacter minatonensis]|uniref:2-phospho-L-lactate transferase CofD family protein n=1 Tax=Patulibacter minatonensis TaxID=298163 RepID=UPI001FDF7ECB|nr:2-phospho-L-lactate transferase CofD family protein [Patulibacter minatonensis]
MSSAVARPLPEAPVVVLAGGTGGAKLARGILQHAQDDLVVIANTGDDVEIHGGLVSPDPDLVTFWLADRIDERGWGLKDDTFLVMDALRELGDDVWFNLGDRDLALCVRRARRLAEGARPTEVLAENAAAYGVAAHVLPPADEPVRTRVRADDRWWDFQEFMIRRLREEPAPVVLDVAFDGAEQATATPEVLRAIASARAIVVGPSNPVISIGPILAVPGVREALRSAAAPVVAVAPLVDGQVLKGPTASFLRWADVSMDAPGIARVYDGLLDGLLTDEEVELPGVAVRTANVLMADAESRASVAADVLAFAADLAAGDRSPA